jgi:glutamate-ammonia-ligase adenylyltransferase
MNSNRFDHTFSWIMALDQDEPSYTEGLITLLESAGFQQAARSATNIRLLADTYSVEQLLRVTLSALRTPSPDLALNGFERLAGVIHQSEIVSLLANKRRLLQLLTVLGASPFLTTLLIRDPSYYTQLFVEQDIDTAKQRPELLQLLRSGLPVPCDMQQLMK